MEQARGPRHPLEPSVHGLPGVEPPAPRRGAVGRPRRGRRLHHPHALEHPGGVGLIRTTGPPRPRPPRDLRRGPAVDRQPHPTTAKAQASRHPAAVSTTRPATLRPVPAVHARPLGPPGGVLPLPLPSPVRHRHQHAPPQVGEPPRGRPAPRSTGGSPNCSTPPTSTPPAPSSSPPPTATPTAPNSPRRTMPSANATWRCAATAPPWSRAPPPDGWPVDQRRHRHQDRRPTLAYRGCRRGDLDPLRPCGQ